MEQPREVLGVSTVKLGLDIHGVIDNNAKFFSELTKDLMLAGWEVHIITGSSLVEKDIRADLADMLISYTHIFSVHDHLKNMNAKTNKELGIPSKYPFPEDMWNTAKAEYCKNNNINMHIDDMPEYLQHFSTPSMLYKGGQ